MSLSRSSSRQVLGVVSDSRLNIHNNTTSHSLNDDVSTSKALLKHNAHSTPIRAQKDNTNPMKRNISALSSSGGDEGSKRLSSLSDSEVEDSPKLKRARLLKMKLKLAYFKVKTNQTETPLNDLKFPSASDSKASTSKSKSIFHSKKPSKKRSSSSSSSSHKPAGLKTQKKSIMDDVVTKKGAFANLKRFNREFNNNNSGNNTNGDASNMQYITVPSSAPPGVLTFNHHFHFSHLNHGTPSFISSVTSPSRFAINSVDKKHVKLPPVPKLLGYPTPNIFHISRHSMMESQTGDSNSNNNNNNSNSIATVHDFHDTTIEERLETEKEGNDTTILQNESMSTPLLRRRHSIDQMERNDPDLTILQSNNSILMSTPVRQKGRQMKKSKSATQSKPKGQAVTTTSTHTNSITEFTTPSSKKRLPSVTDNKNHKTENNSNSKHNNSILKDEDETQLMSSPTRLLSTPSSIGAAKCLLQLAHR